MTTSEAPFAPTGARPAANMAPVNWQRRWLRRVMVGVVLAYVGVLILAPLFGLVVGAFAEGLAGVLAIFRDPEVIKAFGLTLRISLGVVAVQAVFGTLVAWMLVLIDVMKELPATLMLRPFNFDTLAVIAQQLSQDERLAEAALPSLAIVAIGIIPVVMISRVMFRTPAPAAAPAGG